MQLKIIDTSQTETVNYSTVDFTVDVIACVNVDSTGIETTPIDFDYAIGAD